MQNAEVPTVKAAGTYSYHSALKGFTVMSCNLEHVTLGDWIVTHSKQGSSDCRFPGKDQENLRKVSARTIGLLTEGTVWHTTHRGTWQGSIQMPFLVNALILSGTNTFISFEKNGFLSQNALIISRSVFLTPLLIAIILHFYCFIFIWTTSFT
jgi:hypothetical protein